MKGYSIEEIGYRQAMDIVVEKHYLHRKSPFTKGFGLFDNRDQIVGVIVYGSPASRPLCRGIAGPEHEHNVYELTRLWVDDAVPRNGESFLIGNTIKTLDKEFIVSYAEPSQGHVGTVYQATNWLYTGLSAKRSNWVIEGISTYHNRTMTHKYTSKELKEIYGDRFKLVPRPRKHRYLYINAPKLRRKHLINDIRYPLLPYPKKEDHYKTV